MLVNYNKKREFLQLCETYKPGRHIINGWYVSTKLDGMRCFYDGGITRGMLVEEVPWANVEKDQRLKELPIATGLWSRLGKVVHAPEWWLDKLPAFPLDGELFIAANQFQKLQSTVRSFKGKDWESVRYMIFDSPPYEEIFKDGLVEVRVGNQKYSREFKGIAQWLSHIKPKVRSVGKSADFSSALHWIRSQDIENDVVKILAQGRLPTNTSLIAEAVDSAFIRALDEGQEGIILRAPYESWRAMRAHYLLKYKPFQDAEGIVKGYVWGKGKHSGKMGSLVVEWEGKEFKLSGFTDAERYLDEQGLNPTFPIGTAITFRYRELTTENAPREGRYLRKRDE